jgi:O-antigen/teichoic acid export membrane protein
MTGIRRALLFTSAERYINLAVNFGLIAVVSRLLTPAEIGVSAFGATIWALVETLRDVPSTYLVQQKELTREDIRTSFTVMFAISLTLAGALMFSAEWIAAQYGVAEIAPYLHVFALAFLPGPIERPIMALFRRDLAFGKYALINITTVAVNAVVTVSLVLLGFSYQSFAWAALAGALSAASLALYFRRDFWIFRPHLGHWRRAVRFGGYSSLYALLNQLADMLPYLVLSKVARFEGVGFYNRALLVSQTPGKLLLSGLSPVVFPALAAEVRKGGDLKIPFLTATSYISGVYWPAFVLLALLAHPAVEILVGAQWFSIVPLVQIIAVAMLFTFTAILIYPTLMAVGAMRDLLISGLITMPIMAGISGVAALYGLVPLALSLIVTYALQAGVGLIFVRWHLRFRWRELGAALSKSVIVTLCTAAPPAAHIVAAGMRFEMSIAHGIISGIMAVAAWFAGLWITRHPLRDEIVLIAGILRARLRRPAPPALPAERLRRTA